ncbi:MAG: UDP-N-acetylmuramoyl-L-alanyl-D-glutamate--2,6-diaminopimelate ligase [Gemmatimonadota bacterium]
MSRTPFQLNAVAQRLRDAQLLLETRGPLDIQVTGVSQDSRTVRPGDLFLAWRGVDHDAHDFLDQVASSGAVAAVVEDFDQGVEISQLRVSNGRLAGALAADEAAASPWRSLFLAGVTGTNGKTTTAVLARYLLETRGPAGALGTLGLMEPMGRVRPDTEGLTTPGPVQIAAWTRSLVDAGAVSMVLEASSHALAQYRLDGLRFDAAVFTNLGRDHMDYHPDLAAYRDAKLRLLDLLKPRGWAVVNADVRAWSDADLPEGRTLTVGLDNPADLRATEIHLHPGGSRFRLSAGGDEAEVNLPLLGRFNVENALVAAGVARVKGMTVAEIAAGLSSAPQVPGRLQVVVSDPFTVLIDFAHTPDALERVLSTLRPLVRGRLMVLFGAGGDRDRGKRAPMGRAVAKMADLSFVTSDNPRTEDPERIIDDVLEGMGSADHRTITDRREAIHQAVKEARAGDLLLLAGKGHESYQVLGEEKHDFDEAGMVLESLGVLKGRGAS